MAIKKHNYLDRMKEGRRTGDLKILKQIINDSSRWKCETMRLNEKLFEKTFNLKALRKKPVTKELLKRELDYERVTKEITTYMMPLIPAGSTLREQVESLLPTKLTMSEERRGDANSLSYIFCRMITERVPKRTRLPVVVPGLDCLSAAILSIYYASSTVDQKLPWLFLLWSYKMEEFKTEAIESIINAFINDSTERDFIDRFEHIKKKIEKVLAEDNPFSRRVNEWYRRAQAGDKGTEKNLQEEISLELARIKGFGGVDQKENIEVRDVSVSPPNVLGLRPDGPIANEHERFLQMLRQEINILSYPPLTRLCTKLAAQGDTERMTAQDIEQISRFQGRSAYYEFERIEHFLQERYIPSFRRLGLRYRYFFTPRQRPSVLSDGLVERMILNEYDIRGCTVHLEPLLSDGPASHSIPDGTIEAVVEEEIVSMRMDMYDTKNNTWAPEVSSESQKRTDKRANHIEWATDECDNIPFSLTERQVELLGILWRFEGARGQRKWLINQIGYPARTANRLLRQMRDARVLKLMYLPAIEFCGLPDALMVVANCYDRRSRDSLADYLCRKLPFARVLFGDSNDVVAHARIPRKQSDIISITIREAMKENSDRSFVGRLRESNTFRMTVLHRIRDANAQTWTDPWSA